MTGHQFQIAAADILLPIADAPHGIRSGIFQPFDSDADKPDLAKLAVRVKGQQYEIAMMRGGIPDELVYDRMLEAARNFADRTKGTLQ